EWRAKPLSGLPDAVRSGPAAWRGRAVASTAAAAVTTTTAASRTPRDQAERPTMSASRRARELAERPSALKRRACPCPRAIPASLQSRSQVDRNPWERSRAALKLASYRWPRQGVGASRCLTGGDDDGPSTRDSPSFGD